MLLKQELIDFIVDKLNSEKLPFYVYNVESIRNNCRKFIEIPYPHKSIHFASMANVNPHFLGIVREEGLSAFANSVNHCNILISAGFEGGDLVFTSSGMDDDTMSYVNRIGAQVNLDSPSQLKRWKELFPGKYVGIRCNIGEMTYSRITHAGFFIGEESRLGFNIKEIKDLKGDPFIIGLHLYVGTDIFEIGYLINCYRQLIRLVGYFSNIQYLNLGGGFGIDNQDESSFDMEEYKVKVSELMCNVSSDLHRPIKMILEPGRIIGGNAGYFVCRVTDVKKRSNNFFVGVNASSVQFPRPLLYPDVPNHPVVLLRNGQIVKNGLIYRTSVFGCSTYSRDFLCRDVDLPLCEIGDIVVFGNAGSYSASSYLEFLGFTKPREYFI
jgi:diaminopimelate decarboxylase